MRNVAPTEERWLVRSASCKTIRNDSDEIYLVSRAIRRRLDLVKKVSSYFFRL